MRHLWFRNRSWLKKQGPTFSKTFSTDALEGFARFKASVLKYNVPKSTLDQLSSEEKDAEFTKYYSGRKLWFYDHRIEGGKVIQEESYKLFPKMVEKMVSRKGTVYYKKKPYVINGKVVDEIRDVMLVKPTKSALFKGISPIKCGHRPQTYKYPDMRAVEFLTNCNKTNLTKYFNPSEHERVMVSGSWPSQWKEFQAMCDPVDHEVTYSDYDKALIDRFSKLKLPKLPAPVASDVYLTETNQNANTGFMSSIYFGATHKIADVNLKSVATHLFYKTGSRLCADVSLWSVGGRERYQKKWDDGPCRSRMLLMPEGPNKILGLVYAQPVYNAFNKVNWGPGGSEIKLGMSEYHGQYRHFSDFWANLDCTVFEADIKRHDQNTIEETMVTAFGLLRSCFPPGKRIDLHFYYFMSGFIFKNVITPGRWVYRLLKGLPTGSPFTSLIVSLVNWLNQSAYLSKIDRSMSSESVVNVYGDDTKIGIPCKYIHRNVDTLGSPDWHRTTFKQFIGHTLDPVKLTFEGQDDPRLNPTFLKTYSFHGLPARSPGDVIVPSMMMGGSKVSHSQYITKLTGQAYTSAFDLDAQTLILTFREWLRYDIITRAGPLLTTVEYNRVRDSYIRATQNGVNKVYFMPIVPGFEKKKVIEFGAQLRSVSYGEVKSTRFNQLIARGHIYCKPKI